MSGGIRPEDEARYPIEADAEFPGQAVEAPYLGGAATRMGSFEVQTGYNDIPDYGADSPESRAARSAAASRPGIQSSDVQLIDRPPAPPPLVPEGAPANPGTAGTAVAVPTAGSQDTGNAPERPRSMRSEITGFFSELFDAKPFFDANGNGKLDPWDLPGAALGMQVAGDRDAESGAQADGSAAGSGAQDPVQMQKLPLFVILQTTAVLGPWIIEIFKQMGGAGGDRGLLDMKVGFESLFPGSTDLLLTKDCEDYRGEFWRWITYQWTHVGITHVLTNTLLNVTVGIALEGFHGTWITALIFNVGVFGGAMIYRVVDAHDSVVGMSGGCYALLGMFLATTLMNWNQMKYPRMRLFYAVLIAAVDLLQASLVAPEEDNSVPSYSVHFGGYITGLILGITQGRNLVLEEWERTIRWIAMGIGFVLFIFCFSWGLVWAPRNIFESEGWCWARQVNSIQLFGDESWHCVKCASEDCVNFYEALYYVSQVSVSLCDDKYGWFDAYSR